MTKNLFIFITVIFVLTGCSASKSDSKVANLKAMFLDVTINKNASFIPQYYHPDLVMMTNDQKMDFKGFSESFIKTCATPIKFDISYDEETLLEQGDRVAARLFITTTMPNEAPHKIEVMLIATYKEGKIHRLWELTYPDWSKLPEFTKDESLSN